MAGWTSSKPNQPITGINVTPLVDITLVLLIIFMVTAKLVVSRAIPLDLPQAATGGEVQEVFAVSLSAGGVMSIDGQVVSGDRALLIQARRAREQNPELRAVVRADGVVQHQRVMQVLDVLRQAGVSRVAFAVSPGEKVEPAAEGSEVGVPAPCSKAGCSNADRERGPAPRKGLRRQGTEPPERGVP